MQDIVKSTQMRKLNSQEIKRSFQKIGCAMDARNWGIWFTAVHSSLGLTIPVRLVIPDRSDRSGMTGLTSLVRPELLWTAVNHMPQFLSSMAHPIFWKLF